MHGVKPQLRAVEADFLPVRCPAAPSWLCAHGKREWRRVAPVLHRRKLLGPDTMATLESYCAAIGMVRRYQDTMTRDGDVIVTPAGPKRHPVFGMLVSAMREARLLAAELGLTPHRRGIAAGDDGHGDDWSDSDLLA
jgi:P27 family predicted phage terminase small subunit